MMYSKSVLNPPKTYSVTDIPISTADGFKYFNSLNNTFYDKTFTLTNAWKLRKISEIKNPEFESEFNDKRIEFKSLYNNVEMWETRLGFLTTIKDQMIEKVADIGLEIKLCPYNFLGHNISGVHVSQNADICLLEASEKVHTGEEVILIVFKFMTGKTKYVPACDQSVLLAPTPKFDSHVCDERPDPKQVFTSQYIKSLIYLYEFCSSNFDPITRPRHCCPVFALTFLKIGEIKSPPSFGMSAYPTTYGFESSMPVLKSFDLPRQSTYGGYSSSNSVVASAILPSQTNNSASLLIHKTDRNDDRKVTMSRDPWKNLPNTMHPDSDWNSPPPTDYTKPYSSSYLLSSESNDNNPTVVRSRNDSLCDDNSQSFSSSKSTVGIRSLSDMAVSESLPKIDSQFVSFVDASHRFFKHLLQQSETEKKTFLTPQSIPCNLRGNCESRRKLIIKVLEDYSRVGILQLAEVKGNIGYVCMYVAMGSILFEESHESPRRIRMERYNALRMEPFIWRLGDPIIETEKVPVVVAFEIELEENELQYDQYKLNELVMPPKSVFDEHLSFSRINPVKDELLCFVGMSYGFATKSDFVLVGVTTLNNRSVMTFDSLLSPRRQISNLDTHIHGITSTQIEESPDEPVVLERLADHIKGKLLIGFDLEKFLRVTRYPYEMFVGLRDLSWDPQVVGDKGFQGYREIMLDKFKKKVIGWKSINQAIDAHTIFYQVHRKDSWKDSWYPSRFGVVQQKVEIAVSSKQGESRRKSNHKGGSETTTKSNYSKSTIQIEAQSKSFNKTQKFSDPSVHEKSSVREESFQSRKLSDENDFFRGLTSDEFSGNSQNELPSCNFVTFDYGHKDLTNDYDNQNLPKYFKYKSNQTRFGNLETAGGNSSLNPTYSASIELYQQVHLATAAAEAKAAAAVEAEEKEKKWADVIRNNLIYLHKRKKAARKRKAGKGGKSGGKSSMKTTFRSNLRVLSCSDEHEASDQSLSNIQSIPVLTPMKSVSNNSANMNVHNANFKQTVEFIDLTVDTVPKMPEIIVYQSLDGEFVLSQPSSF